MTVLSLDVESRSAVDLKKAGAHRYWEDETTDLWCACYAFDDEPVETWRPGDPVPPRIAAHVEAGGTISAWNAAFERLAWWGCLTPRYGWPRPRLEQFDDTAAWGAALSIPRGLGDAAKAMGLEEEKDDEGYRLMLRMSKPRRPRKDEPDGLYWWDDEARVQRLISYCVKDVEAERALRKVLVPLSEAERQVYLLDARMNDRGILLDVPLVHKLIQIVEQEKKRLDKAMKEATGGWVAKCSEAAKLTKWLRDVQGVEVDSLAKAALADLLNLPDLPPEARRSLEIRKEAAKSSTAKLNAMLACVCKDGRARGQHLYHGAGTGRWAGKLIQVQNMPRGYDDKDPLWFDQERAVSVFMHGSAEVVELIYGSPMSAVSHMLRACFRAADGHRLIVADFSSIEGRVTAWAAEEAWKLLAFRDADAGRGAGIYELTAAGIFAVDVASVDKKKRQVGKVAELALGYQGGVVAFDSMAKVYFLDMATAFEPIRATTDSETWARAEKRYEECLERGDTGTDVLTWQQWMASEVTKVLWRRRHPATAALWKGLEEAAFDAVVSPGQVYGYNGCDFIVRRGFLWMRLPSERCLAYGAPKVQDRKQPWGDTKATVTCLGVNSTTKKWERYPLYGGLLTENAVQAIARDLMANGMLKAEEAGYPIILTVHDEAAAEVEEGFGSVKEFEDLLCDLPDWATGIPLVAEGYEARRYRK